MKNYVKNLLKAGVFVLAAVFAFAFTEPVDPMQQKFGVDNIGRVFDVTHVNYGTGANEYQCDLTSKTCTWADESLTIPVETNGQFMPGSGLQPIPD